MWTGWKPPLVNYSCFAATSFFISQTNNSALIVIDKPCDGTYASLFCISSALLVCLSKLPVKFDGHFSIEFNVNNSVFCTSYFNVLFAMKAKNTFFFFKFINSLGKRSNLLIYLSVRSNGFSRCRKSIPILR